MCKGPKTGKPRCPCIPESWLLGPQEQTAEWKSGIHCWPFYLEEHPIGRQNLAISTHLKYPQAEHSGYFHDVLLVKEPKAFIHKKN